MIKYNITYIIGGPASTIRAENTDNPIEAANWQDVMSQLAIFLDDQPEHAIARIVGVQVELVL